MSHEYVKEEKFFRIPGTNKFVRMRIIADSDPPNPRKDYDQLGKMICFHKRYDLGDEHPYSDPDDFLRTLANEIDPTVCDRIDFWENGKGYVQISNRYTEWRDVSKAIDERVNKIIHKALDKVEILPLYIYDHSGITMSTRRFSCPWDSGQVGWIYATPEMIQKEYGKVTKSTRKKARKLLEAEVREYDQYITGDVWGYVVEAYQLNEHETSLDALDEDEWLSYSVELTESAESCWGFFGDDYCEEEAMNAVYSAILDHLPLAEICARLMTSCDCRKCLTCYVKTMAGGYDDAVNAAKAADRLAEEEEAF